MLALVLLAGCPRPLAAIPADPDAGPADAGASQGQDAGLDAGSADDAGIPYAVLLRVAADGGLREIAGAPASLEPTSQLVLEVSPRPADLRVRLFDASDLVVESNDVVTELDGGLRYELQLLEPLRAGRAYLLVLDAEQGPALLDRRGRPLEDVRLGLLVRGDPAAEAPSRSKRRPRR